MVEHPIIFSSEMVRALLEGRKTQTRRVPTCANSYVDGRRVASKTWKSFGFDFSQAWADEGPSPAGNAGPYLHVPCRNGITHRVYPIWAVGDSLWIRETWRALDDYNGVGYTSIAAEIYYRADLTRMWRDIPEEKQEEWFYKLTPWVNGKDQRWRPSIFMPRWASRITREITNVRAELLQEINEEDAIAEGVELNIWDQALVARKYGTDDEWFQTWDETSLNYADVDQIACASFHTLWDSINAKRGFCWDANPWVWVPEFREVK